LHRVDEILLLFDETTQKSINSLWRIADRYMISAPLADLALRLISCGVPVLSMQKNIAWLHGTPFGIPRTKARMRSIHIQAAVKM
jgi:hypothetical protein